MKLKEKLAREALNQEIREGRWQNVFTREDILNSYLLGFEKARELLLEKYDDTLSKGEEGLSYFDIEELGEEES